MLSVKTDYDVCVMKAGFCQNSIGSGVVRVASGQADLCGDLGVVPCRTLW